MTAPDKMYIDGRWVPASDGGVLDVLDPATGQKVATVPLATRSDVAAALAAAERGWTEWRNTDAWTRSAILRRVGEALHSREQEIAATITEEQGKPLAEATSEVRAAVQQFDWFAEEAKRIYGRVVDSQSRSSRLSIIRQPIGPVAAFTPWNFPLILPARKVAPALAAGCSIVLKPAEEAPRSAFWLAWACDEAGVPPGVINVLTGDPAEISGQLIESDVIRKVTLTGSVPVGQHLLRLCADGVKAVTMELGGHAPVLVFGDADLEMAVEMSVQAKFRNAGQVCAAPSRFLVHDSLYEEFGARMAKRVSQLRVGSGSDPRSEVGPLSNERRLGTIERLVDEAVSRGGVVLTGGRRPDSLGEGYFYEPTVLSNVDSSMAIMVEEPFGPVAPVMPFTSLEEGLALANGTEFGLAAYLFTPNLKTAYLAAEGLEAGVVGVNNLVVATTEAPFGGVKKSGFGRESGIEGIDAYLVSKSINFTLI